MSVLSVPVLVLNKHWVPIRVTTVMDALSKMFEGHAKAVSEDYNVYDFESWTALRLHEKDAFVTTAKSMIRVPEVILLARYGDVPKKTLAFSRANIYRRDRYTCQYCGSQPGSEELTIDHVKPKSKGGVTSWTNCVLACVRCNRRKANKSPEQAGLTLRSKPIKPSWNPRLVLHKVRNTPANWEKFVSDAYWNQELDHVD